MASSLKKFFFLNRFISRLEDAMQNPVKFEEQKNEYYIINKDIISRYINSEIYKQVEEYINNKNINIKVADDSFIDQLIVDFTGNKNINGSNVKDKENLMSFLLPEKLKVKCYEFPNNFFIIDEDLKKLILESIKNNNNNNTMDNFEYSEPQLIKKQTFVLNEGIFIINSFEDGSGGYKYYVYFIKPMKKINFDDFRINKIYIFNKPEEFKNEYKFNIQGKVPESYFASRNFVNKGGIYNITDNGKKIGLYINIDRIENYSFNEYEEDENRKYLEQFLN